MAELGIDRHMGGMRAIRIGVLLVEEGAFGEMPSGESPASGEGSAVRPHDLAAVDDLDLGGVQPRRFAGLRADRLASASAAASSMAEPPITTERE